MQLNLFAVDGMQHALKSLLSKRMYLLLIAHLVLLSLTFALAFQLRFDLDLPGDMRILLWKALPWVVGLKLLIFHRFGSIHGWWRYVTFEDLAALLRVATLSTLAIASADYFFVANYQIPRSVLILDWGCTIFLIGGLRSVCRLVREILWPTLLLNDRHPALMIGADQGGEALTRQIHNHRRLDYRIVGYLDDNRSHYGSRLGGVPFLGSPEDAVTLAERHQVADVLVIANSISGKRLRRLIDECSKAGIHVKIIPSVDELLNGSYRLQIRDVNIHDLLRREPVQLDCHAIAAMLGGRRVLVTGAGGSIGSEICRQILRHNPESLILVERAENNLFHIQQELLKFTRETTLHACLADVGDESRMHALFRKHRPQIVFHAAAHKHVPLMEANPGEAIKNNVLGTMALVNMSEEHGVEQFVMISTDKAVNPTSVMGVSKQLAERYVHAFSETSSTKFVVVRFGNVLASVGSVVPIFQEQIRCGGPVTVTHPDMERFFMTIPEASQLVLQAAAMGEGGEIFVLDMGEPVKIMDLARDLIRLSGLAPEEVEIKITGVRPGEKLYEELYLHDEQTLATPHPKLRVAYHRPWSLAEVLQSISQLSPLLDEADQVIRQKLRELAPEYCPPCLAESLDDSMPVPSMQGGVQLVTEGN